MSLYKRRIGIALALAAALSLQLQAEVAVNKDCAASPEAAVEVEILAGRVEISGWSEPRVAVTGTAGDEIEELILECTSGRTEISSRLVPRDRRTTIEDTTTHLVIRVPDSAPVGVETVSASITVSDQAGHLSLESVSGVIKVRSRPSSLTVEAVSSRVHVAEAVSPLSVENVSGEIVLDAIRGETSVSSVSGGVTIGGGVGAKVKVESVSGGIHFGGGVESGGSLELESHSGSVTLRLPASISADLRVSTFSGSIDNRLPGGEQPREGGPGEGKSLRLSLGEGGAHIKVETFSGRVELLGD